MSIIIKGMKMPESCGECPFGREEDAQYYACDLSEWSYVNPDGRELRDDCPLIELPPHGLIDKQMLLRNIADNQMANAGMRHDLEYGFWQRMWDYIEDAPTIIEAEVET